MTTKHRTPDAAELFLAYFSVRMSDGDLLENDWQEDWAKCIKIAESLHAETTSPLTHLEKITKGM